MCCIASANDNHRYCWGYTHGLSRLTISSSVSALVWCDRHGRRVTYVGWNSRRHLFPRGTLPACFWTTGDNRPTRVKRRTSWHHYRTTEIFGRSCLFRARTWCAVGPRPYSALAIVTLENSGTTMRGGVGKCQYYKCRNDVLWLYAHNRYHNYGVRWPRW